MWVLVLQRLALEFLLDFFYFPIWWYTVGAGRAGLYCWHLFQDGNIRLAPGLWLKNIFVPMFGQSDFQGRLISFFMRLVNVIGRSLVLVMWFFLVLFLFLLWLIIPVFVGYMLVRSSIT
jgi:hypothetical protein